MNKEANEVDMGELTKYRAMGFISELKANDYPDDRIETVYNNYKENVSKRDEVLEHTYNELVSEAKAK